MVLEIIGRNSAGVQGLQVPDSSEGYGAEESEEELLGSKNFDPSSGILGNLFLGFLDFLRNTIFLNLGFLDPRSWVVG